MCTKLLEIGVIGAGSWGTAIANLLAKNGHKVTLWAYESELVEIISEERINRLYLPNFVLHNYLTSTNSIAECIHGKEIIVLAVPTQYIRYIISESVDYLDENAILVSASKGIENDSLQTMSELLESILPKYSDKLAYLSGPSFANEVAAEIPTAITIASYNTNTANKVQSTFSNSYFRAYTSKDVIGTQIAGAMKNVIAIAAGIVDGLGFGTNTRSALITRGLAEITRLGIAKGACPATFSGLSGMGDLVLTCTGILSRNRTVGFKLGQGNSIEDILSNMNMVAEGVKTSNSAYSLARKHQVIMPITEQIYQVIYEKKPPLLAVSELMSRNLKSE